MRVTTSISYSKRVSHGKKSTRSIPEIEQSVAKGLIKLQERYAYMHMRISIGFHSSYSKTMDGIKPLSVFSPTGIGGDLRQRPQLEGDVHRDAGDPGRLRSHHHLRRYHDAAEGGQLPGRED